MGRSRHAKSVLGADSALFQRALREPASVVVVNTTTDVMGSLTVVELVCSCLSIAGAALLVATLVSKDVYGSSCSSGCALYMKFTEGSGCGKKGVCDTAVFAAFAALAIGVLFVLQLIFVYTYERGSGSATKW